MANRPPVDLNQSFGMRFSASQKEAEQSLQDIRMQNEKDLAQYKHNLQKQFSKSAKTEALKSKDIDIAIISDVHRERERLREKYAVKMAQGAITQGEAEKRIAEEVAEYAYMAKLEYDKKERLAERKKLAERRTAVNALIREEREQKLAIIRDEFNANKKSLEDIEKARKKGELSRKEARAESKKFIEENKKLIEEMRKEGATELEIMKESGRISKAAVKEAIFSRDTRNAVASKILNGFGGLDSYIDTYAAMQSRVNVRLQGSGRSWEGRWGIGGIESNLIDAVGITPYVKFAELIEKIGQFSDKGIAFNIEQRAFLETISNKIASTFDAFDSSLLRIIRLQQADSTAARLGMEASLTQFLNQNFLDSEYLDTTAGTVRANLLEATALLDPSQALSTEYAAQKWLGALSSVGFNSGAIANISAALGQLGSGDAVGLAGNQGMRNLLLMSASRAGLDIADIFIKGLDGSTTNKLLGNMVRYLQEISQSDNKVVKSEFAKIFGMSITDLKAVENVKDIMPEISRSMLDYSGAIGELGNQMGQIWGRMHLSEKMANVFDNSKYSLGTSIANNPAMYSLWKVTSMIENLTGGINLPTIGAFGNFVDLNTTVTNLMRAGIVGVSTLGMIGDIISGIGSTINPKSMLSKLGIDNSSISTITRGGASDRQRTFGGIKTKAGKVLSASAYVGSSSGDDLQDTFIGTAEKESKSKLDSIKAEEDIRYTANEIGEYLLNTFDLRITHIENLLALIASYGATTDQLESAKGIGSDLTTKVNVKYEGLDKIKETNQQLDNISNASNNILALLEKVITDNGIKVISTNHYTGFTGGGLVNA
ncbi:MAG TPA: hypothetical protein GX745_08220 [Clostridiales bacterium]|nr:hypothetical protein [Clostridiales bacterium]